MDSGHLRTSPGPVKRRKVDGNAQASGSGSGGGNGTVTGGDSKKRPVSCDVCRARKVKCVKQEGAERCEGCVTLDQVCSYTHERKKPGPANRYVFFLIVILSPFTFLLCMVLICLALHERHHLQVEISTHQSTLNTATTRKARFDQSMVNRPICPHHQQDGHLIIPRTRLAKHNTHHKVKVKLKLKVNHNHTIPTTLAPTANSITNLH